MTGRTLFTVALTMLIGFVTTALAQEKANPTGTWKWTRMQGDKTREMTLKLKLEGDQLTGALIGRNDQETKIEDAQFKDGQVSFSVTIERNGQKFVTKYSGKLEEDTIRGTMAFERQGQSRTVEWIAKRDK
uniref:Uncharacterized protein n=1 Tax=Schlesneria paludicola TaxID=360056 RepID=A0A7C4LM01_9PLAN